jgi:outer membrane protein assembly factor BamB
MRLKLLPLLAICTFTAAAAHAANWPEWRGLGGTGITEETELPLKWSATENVQWKVELPERSNSTPIVWGDRVFLTQAVGSKRLVMCFDRADGKELWRSGTTWTEPEDSHPTNPYASASPVTDGERVIAWFGSAGILAFDFEGKELWKVDLGKQDHEWGYAAAPVIHGDLVFLNFGPGSRIFLVALDKKTGKEVWRKEQPEFDPSGRTDGFAGNKEGMVGSWSTPLVINSGSRDELIMTWPNWVVAYDPASGNELWRSGGLNPLLYTSSIFGEGIVVGMSGYGGSSVAVRAGGMGDVTESHRVWHKGRDKQRIGSGVITGGHIYILNTPGTAQCIDLKTGETVWEERLRGSGAKNESWASMVLSGDRIYVPNQGGDMFVLKAAPKFELLATNSLNDGLTNSSPVVSDGQIFIRTHRHLWCIGERRK